MVLVSISHKTKKPLHRCYLANLNEVEKYVKGEGGYLVMSDGTTIDVARNKKEMLMMKLLP